MMKSITRFITAVVGDTFGLIRVCGFGVAMRWLSKVFLNFGKCLKARNLQPADIAMGEGPFEVRLGRSKARLSGCQIVSGIREIWVRDVYLANGFLKIPEQATVVDFGTNMGNFTMLALGHGPGVKVVSVEPSSERNALYRRQVEVNGWQDRATLDRCFIGTRGDMQEELLEDKHYHGAEFVSQEEFIARHNLTKINFLKCDIEGSEFGLLNEESPILAMTDQLGIEIHDMAGDRYEFIKMLETCGFEVAPVRHHDTSCVAQARRKGLVVS